MLAPSCPVLVIYDNDTFRSSLIRTLDENHFAVTFTTDGEESFKTLAENHSRFQVVIVGVDLASGKGVKAVEFLRDHRDAVKCGVIILGEPDPELRTFAPWADETLMKPVDPAYVTTRARVYCKC